MVCQNFFVILREKSGAVPFIITTPIEDEALEDEKRLIIVAGCVIIR